MDVEREVLAVLDEVLCLGGRARRLSRQSHLLGAIPEFDSMAVVALVSSIEERFGIVIDDDELSGDTFATIGSLVDFVADKCVAVRG